MKTKKGQATVEAILLMVTLLGIAMLVLQDGMKAGGWMKELVGTPGQYIRGMSIAGAWQKCQIPPSAGSSGSCAAITEHPNQSSVKGLQAKGDDST